MHSYGVNAHLGTQARTCVLVPNSGSMYIQAQYCMQFVYVPGCVSAERRR